VTDGADGLPELVLTSAALSASPQAAAAANLRMLDLGTGLGEDRLAAQIASGLTSDDLTDFGGQLRLEFGPLAVHCEPQVGPDSRVAFGAAMGQARICWLFAANAQRPDVASIPRMVAVRIMSVRELDGDRTEIVLQPAVVSTRTALLSDDPSAVPNPYVYKLQLTP
jgi:hypothetical protein